MLSIAKGANMALMFFPGAWGLVSVAYWGFTVSPNWAIKLLAGLGGVALFIGAWALFGAGGGANATFPLTGLARVALEILCSAAAPWRSTPRAGSHRQPSSRRSSSSTRSSASSGSRSDHG